MHSLITGVSAKGQVGEAVAGALALRGDTVLLVARDPGVNDRAMELKARGLSAHAYICDLADASAVADLAATVRGEHGERIDAVINLAGGFAASGGIHGSDPAIAERLMRINFTTAYLVTRAFEPLLRGARGSVVFFASEAALEGAATRGVAGYAASKAAVIALMRSVADEGRDHGIRSNALAPGSIRTASNEATMGPDARYVEREDVAAVVAFLCSPAARAITGQVIRLRG